MNGESNRLIEHWIDWAIW